MLLDPPFEIFLSAPPGLESWSPKSGYYATLDPRCEKDGLSGWEAETV